MLSSVPVGIGPGVPKSDIGPTLTDRLVQRVPAGGRQVRIGAMLQEKVRQLPVRIRGSHDERTLPVRQRIVDVGARLEERTNRIDTPARTANRIGVNPVGDGLEKVLPDSDIRPPDFGDCSFGR